MPNKATAFALIGDRYHNSDYIRTSLRRTLVQGVDLSIDFTDDVNLLNAENLAGYKLLIMFRDGMVWPNGYGESAFWNNASSMVPITSDPPLPKLETRMDYWMTEEQGKAVRAFVEQGGSALLMHNVTYIATSNADFRHTLGAATEGHPPVRPFKVKITVGNEHEFLIRFEMKLFAHCAGDDDLVFGRDGGYSLHRFATPCRTVFARRLWHRPANQKKRIHRSLALLLD